MGAAGACCLAMAGAAVAAPVGYPMIPTAWHAAPPAGWFGASPARLGFARNEGLPDGEMTVDDGIAVSDTARFGSGTIEFDEKPIGYDDAGIVFRRHGNDGGEFVYLRGNPDCPAAIDCIQYAPVARGRMDWDIYPDFQRPASIAAAGWNHLRITVDGATMRVFVNRSATPTLVVPRLQGLTTDGGLAFKGPAVFANLLVDAAPAAGADVLPPRPVEPGAITDWSAATPIAFPYGRPVSAAAIPPAAAWRPIATEPDGLVNIGRAYRDGFGAQPELAWLRTTIDAPAGGRRHLRLGWALQVAVFLNGTKVFAGENPYFPVERRLAPGGRLAPDNATIALDLRPGRNVLVLAVGNAWERRAAGMIATPYGWGAEAHLSD